MFLRIFLRLTRLIARASIFYSVLSRRPNPSTRAPRLAMKKTDSPDLNTSQSRRFRRLRTCFGRVKNLPADAFIIHGPPAHQLKITVQDIKVALVFFPPEASFALLRRTENPAQRGKADEECPYYCRRAHQIYLAEGSLRHQIVITSARQLSQA